MPWHNVKLYVNANLPIHVCHTGGPQSLHFQHFLSALDVLLLVNMSHRLILLSWLHLEVIICVLLIN